MWNTSTFERIAESCGGLLEIDPRTTALSVLTEAKSKINSTTITDIPQVIHLKIKSTLENNSKIQFQKGKSISSQTKLQNSWQGTEQVMEQHQHYPKAKVSSWYRQLEEAKETHKIRSQPTTRTDKRVNWATIQFETKDDPADPRDKHDNTRPLSKAGKSTKS